VETSETEHWQNGKMETTAAKNIHCKIKKLRKKQKFLASRLQRTGMTSSLKKLLTDCFKTLADSPKTGLLAARAISTWHPLPSTSTSLTGQPLFPESMHTT